MKKWIIILGVVVIVIAGGLFFGLSKIGPLVKTAVNTYGPNITSTEVRLGDVDVSLFSAQAKIRDFYLGNPKGFKTPEAMTVESILVDVNESTLTQNTLIIDRIEVIRPQLTYETIAKTDNFRSILKNISKGTKKGSSPSAKKKSNGKKIIIKDFKLTNGQVNLAASLLGQNKSVSTTLPDIHLTNIGEKKGGVTPEKAFQVIFAELQKRINSPDVLKAFDEELSKLKIDPATLEKNVPKELKEAGDVIKGLLGN